MSDADYHICSTSDDGPACSQFITGYLTHAVNFAAREI
ncbi:Hypothetical protein ADU72_0038 (plasmid) [Pediococcus damnosus]|uniref:Uncharacterized protein n=1 Tax=Pediococcus damnosus TaxID=51663 RepID=A0ABN4NHU8_9LACO|nr:Hypothetical protein ADU72_0038 [Pediococcus damnosus]